MNVPIIYSFTLFLHTLIPGSEVQGYACDYEKKVPLKYKLNGIVVLINVVILWMFASMTTSFYDLSELAGNYGHNFFVANTLGIISSLYFFFRGRSLPFSKREVLQRCPTKDKPIVDKATYEEDKLVDARRSSWAHFFYGQEFNPRIFGVDVKMFLYLVGAVMLLLNVLSVAFVNLEENSGALTNAMMVETLLISHFVIEYLFFEEIHLYTYDLFAEKIGFKLVWGCLVFYPFFYSLPAQYLVNQNYDISSVQGFFISALFYSGWFITRGSNIQKFKFKVNPTASTATVLLLFTVKQETIPGTRILVSGFWGVARHLNYLGEILQAIAISFPPFLVSGSLVPLLYPVYYILLFLSRAEDDDKLCSAKYGEAWKRYRKVVPYKMLPMVW